jgi:hypothetical protein
LAGARVAFVKSGGADGEIAERVAGFAEALAGGGRSVKTDDAGKYSLKDLPEGEHRLRITHRERAMPTAIGITLRQGENVRDIELDMTSLRGVVRDPEGNAVSGARVVARRARSGAEGQVEGVVESVLPAMGLADPGSIKTELDGSFVLRGVEPGVELEVVATGKGFAPAETKITATGGTTSAIGDLRLGAAGTVKVTSQASEALAMVTAQFTGEGAAAPASPMAPVTQMARRGKATLTGLRPGTWKVTLQTMQGGEGAKERTVQVVAGQTTTVEF